MVQTLIALATCVRKATLLARTAAERSSERKSGLTLEALMSSEEHKQRSVDRCGGEKKKTTQWAV